MSHSTVLSIIWTAFIEVLEDAESSLNTQQSQELLTLLRFYEDDLRAH